MCCCGNEHDADPPYKTSRSAACCTLTIEIILMIVNVVLWIAVAVAGILVCAIAAATEPEKKTTRRLGEISVNRPATADLTSPTTMHLIDSYAPYLVPGFDSKFTNGDFITSILTKGQHSAGRRLDACDDDEDCSKLKKAGQTGCNAASTILSMFWFNNLFALLGVIFYAMVACNCCKGCCGGYQDKNKMVMIYSVIAAIWGLVKK
eukprot:g451.t1